MSNFKKSTCSADPAARRKRFWSHFPECDRIMLAMVPASEEESALQAASDAKRAGMDGVFLVNQDIGFQKLLRVAGVVALRYPTLFVGVNCLDLRPQDVFCRLPVSVRGVWTSHGTLGGSSVSPAAILAARQESAWNGLHFVENQLDAEDPGAAQTALAAAREYADVIVLSSARSGELLSVGRSPAPSVASDPQLPMMMYKLPATSGLASAGHTVRLATACSVCVNVPLAPPKPE